MSSEVLSLPLAAHSWLFYVNESSDDAGLHVPLLDPQDVSTQLFTETVGVWETQAIALISIAYFHVCQIRC